MKRILQINSVAGFGSTGRIAEEIGSLAIACGWESWIAYGRGRPASRSNLIRIGNDFDIIWHGIHSKLFDRHGLASKHATKTFINKIERTGPDVIHLHNIHGYYLNYPLLCEFLKEWGGPVVWTLHDCWPFTGHCANFQHSNCLKWKSGCSKCTQVHTYPASLHLDRSKSNFIEKQEAFQQIIPQLSIVTVSEWLNRVVRESFFSGANITTIHNGIDISVFKPVSSASVKPTVLGVAYVWTEKKGIDEFVYLRKNLPEDCRIILVGLTQKQIRELPPGITGLSRTASKQQLAELYSNATVFVNPTKEETLSLTNIEAQSCGTPVVCYATGGTPETISPDTGALIPPGDKEALLNAVNRFLKSPAKEIGEACRERAVRLFDQRDRFAEYINLYRSLV